MSRDAVDRAIEIVRADEWEGDMRVNMTRVIGAGRVLASEVNRLRCELVDAVPRLVTERNLWRIAARQMYNAIGEGTARGRPLDLIAARDWQAIVGAIAAAEAAEKSE